MKKETSLRSLKLYVLLLVGTMLAAFTLIFFLIFQTTMPRMLLESEANYLSRQFRLVDGLLSSARGNLALLTQDTATWHEAASFAQGKNPNFITNNWSSKSLLESFRLNFVIIKGKEGNDLYTDFLNVHTNETMSLPRGLSGELNGLAKNVAERYTSGLPFQVEHGKEGIFFYNRTAYNVAIMPIISSQEDKDLSGILILGNVLDNEYFQTLAHHTDAMFSIEEDLDVTQTADNPLHFLNKEAVTIRMQLTGIDGKPLVLVMTEERKIYAQGHEYLSQANALMIAAIFLLGIAIYLIVVKLMLNPIGQLSADIQKITESADIGSAGVVTEKYSKSREFIVLCSSIDSMLKKLGQSNISLSTLQDLLNGIDAYLYAVDSADDSILFMNEKMRRHYGVKEDPTGKPCEEVLHEDAHNRRTPHSSSMTVSPSGASVIWEESNPRTNRTYRYTKTLIKWAHGRMAHLQYSVDITEIKSVEQSLKKRLEQQELMVRITHSFIATASAAERIGNALRMAGEFMGISKIALAKREDALVLHTAYEWSDQSDTSETPRITGIAFAPGMPEYDGFVLQKRPYIAHDDIRRMEEFASPYYEGVSSLACAPVHVFGELWGVLSFSVLGAPRPWSESDMQLITLIATIISGVMERSTQETQLTRMSSIVESAPQFISYVSPNGKLEYVNKGSETALGYTREELLSSGIALLLDSENYTTVIQDILPHVIERGTSSFELPLILKNGELRIFSFSSFSIYQNQEIGIGAITQDVTEQRLLQKELIAAKEQAEKSNMAKSEFLSRMSHEMRTPLNAIIGMTNIGSAAADITKKQYCLDKIDEASIHLLGVINDILDMAKIEANKFELSYTEFSFNKMLMRVVDVINFRVDEKEQSLTVNISPDIPYSIINDEQRLAQVITNLLANAVKFTPKRGSITLTAEKTEEKDSECTICISVEDSGIGISTENQAKLFNSFEQADGGISRKFGGTGLGLSISKRIVNLMGGRIWVESEEGKGARFSFTLKAQRGSATSESALADIDWNRLRTLVVDDAPEVGEYFKKLAGNLGFTCVVARNGFEAIDILKKKGEKYFDLVFVDWKMPNMDGIELARKITATIDTPPEIILISAAEWGDIEKEATAAGVKKILSKPLFAAAIVEAVNAIMASQATTKNTVGLANGKSLSDYAILLAEDVDINREIVLTMLEHTGITIDCAKDGAEACTLFQANPDKYAMIFMDIHMPEVDGYEATRRIRSMESLPRAKDIPIIAMTANVFREDIERCLASGMNDHIGKPINFTILLQKLNDGCGRQ